MVGYREDVAHPSIRTQFPIVARMRLFDSLLLPGGVLLSVLVARAVFVPQLRLVMMGAVVLALLAEAYHWHRFHRPCVLESPYPHNTIELSIAGDRGPPRRLEVERIARIVPSHEIANDTGIWHVVFILNDGSEVPLCTDINFFWGIEHAESLAARTREFVARVHAQCGLAFSDRGTRGPA